MTTFHTTSASSLSLLHKCQLKWYYAKVLKLPLPPPSKSQALGSVLHSVAARVLLQEQEIYPGSWESFRDGYNNDGDIITLNAKEQAIVQALIEKGLAAGIFRQSPGLKVEEPFDYNLFEIEGKGRVRIVGSIDMFSDTELRDHKTASKPCYAAYWSDPQGLLTDTQLLTYAIMRMRSFLPSGTLVESPEDWVPAKRKNSKVTVGHNYFITKEPHKVKEVSVTLTEHELWEIAHEHVNGLCTTMYSIMTEEKEAKPDTTGKECQNYGGCPFIEICKCGMSIEEFRELKTKNTEKEKMNEELKKKLMAMRPAVSQTAEAETKETIPAAPSTGNISCAWCKGTGFRNGKPCIMPNCSAKTNPPVNTSADTPVPEPVPEPTEVPIQSSKKPPSWYREGCIACANQSRPGYIDETGEPCRICLALSEKELDEDEIEPPKVEVKAEPEKAEEPKRRRNRVAKELISEETEPEPEPETEPEPTSAEKTSPFVILLINSPLTKFSAENTEVEIVDVTNMAIQITSELSKTRNWESLSVFDKGDKITKHVADNFEAPKKNTIYYAPFVSGEASWFVNAVVKALITKINTIVGMWK